MFNFYHTVMKNQIWLVIVLLIVTIIVLVFNSKFRAKVYNPIAQAEIGALSKESLVKSIVIVSFLFIFILIYNTITCC